MGIGECSIGKGISLIQSQHLIGLMGITHTYQFSGELPVIEKAKAFLFLASYQVCQHSGTASQDMFLMHASSVGILVTFIIYA